MSEQEELNKKLRRMGFNIPKEREERGVRIRYYGPYLYSDSSSDSVTSSSSGLFTTTSPFFTVDWENIYD